MFTLYEPAEKLIFIDVELNKNTATDTDKNILQLKNSIKINKKKGITISPLMQYFSLNLHLLISVKFCQVHNQCIQFLHRNCRLIRIKVCTCMISITSSHLSQLSLLHFAMFEVKNAVPAAVENQNSEERIKMSSNYKIFPH